MRGLALVALAACVHDTRPTGPVPEAAVPWLVEVRGQSRAWSRRAAVDKLGDTYGLGAEAASAGEVVHARVRTGCTWVFATVVTLGILPPCWARGTGRALDSRLAMALREGGWLPPASGVGRPRWISVWDGHPHGEGSPGFAVLQTIHGIPVLGAELVVMDAGLRDVRADRVVHLAGPPATPAVAGSDLVWIRDNEGPAPVLRLARVRDDPWMTPFLEDAHTGGRID